MTWRLEPKKCAHCEKLHDPGWWCCGDARCVELTCASFKAELKARFPPMPSTKALETARAACEVRAFTEQCRHEDGVPNVVNAVRNAIRILDDIGVKLNAKEARIYWNTLTRHANRKSLKQGDHDEPDRAELEDQPPHVRHIARAAAELTLALETMPIEGRRDLLAVKTALVAVRSIGHPNSAPESTSPRQNRRDRRTPPLLPEPKLEKLIERLLGTGGALGDAVDQIELAVSDFVHDENENVEFGMPARDDEFAADVEARLQRKLASRRFSRSRLEDAVAKHRAARAGPGRPRKDNPKSTRRDLAEATSILIGIVAKPKNVKRALQKANARTAKR